MFLPGKTLEVFVANNAKCLSSLLPSKGLFFVQEFHTRFQLFKFTSIKDENVIKMVALF